MTDKLALEPEKGWTVWFAGGTGVLYRSPHCSICVVDRENMALCNAATSVGLDPDCT